MNVVIIGCGRVGGFLAGLLDAGGHTVTIVDIDSRAFDRLPSSFKGTTLLGSGTDMGVLRQAGVEKSDALLTLTEGDNRNIMAAQIAKEIFGVNQVIAKVNDPIRAQTYRSHGLITISRTTILGTLLEALLVGNKEIGPNLLAKAMRYEAELSGETLERR